jgi:F-box and WD-40 domain protein CDC4
MKGHTQTVRGLKMVNGTTLVSGSRDATLRVWDLETGECLKVLEGHEKTIRSMAVHGDIVVSGSYDNDARVWNSKTGECLNVLKGHTSKIYAVVFDGNVVATGSMGTYFQSIFF